MGVTAAGAAAGSTTAAGAAAATTGAAAAAAAAGCLRVAGSRGAVHRSRPPRRPPSRSDACWLSVGDKCPGIGVADCGELRHGPTLQRATWECRRDARDEREHVEPRRCRRRGRRWPSRSATHRSTLFTKSSSWVATTREAPSRCTASSSSRSATFPVASRPTNGSSTSNTSNGRTNASVIAAFCRRPRLKRVGRSSARSYRPDMTEQIGRALLPVFDAVQARRVLEVLPHAQVVVERRRVGQERRRRSGARAIRLA